MTEKLKHILDSYEDFELAFLSKYNLNTYTDQTIQSIKKYIHSRGLTESKINELIELTNQTVFPDYHSRCPRCKSNKIRTENIEYSNTTSSDTATILDGMNGTISARIRQICNVCEYYISDPNNESSKSKTSFSKLVDLFFEIFKHY
jgi:hypothetical protein